MKTYYRMSEAANYLNIGYRSLRKYVLDGEIDYCTTPNGQKTFTEQQLIDFANKKHAKIVKHTTPPTNIITNNFAFYVRDSEGDKTTIQNQIQALEQTYGTPVKIYKDAASGLNEKRKGLQQLIKDAQNHKFSQVIITNKDRLTRFGYTYIELLLQAYGINIIVMNYKDAPKTPQEEFIADFMSLIASFSGKYYKLRSLKNEQRLLERAIHELEETK